MRYRYDGSVEIWQLFIRHAHRNTEDRTLDNGLSEKGKRQCEVLLSFLEDLKPLRRPKKVYSSPKRRCMETAEYVAAWAGVNVIEDPDLDEQRDHEGDRDFLQRVRAWYQKHKGDKSCCFVSHADVLPIIARLAGTLRSEVKKGDFLLIENESVKMLNPIHESGRDK